MNPQTFRRLPIIAGLAVLSFGPAHAALIITNSVSTALDTNNAAANGIATAGTYSSQVSSTDLINAGRPTLSSTSWDKTPFFETNTVNNGTGHPSTGTTGNGTYLPANFGTAAKLPFTYTATLNLTTNTFGYDLQTIRVFAGWNQNGASLANVKFEVLLSQVGNSGFTSLGTYEYSPYTNASTQEAGASMVTLQNNTGSGTTPFATGVDAVRFVVMDHGFNSADAGSGGVDGSVYLEFDVLGTPTKNNFEKWAGDFGIPVDDHYDGLDHDGIRALLEYALGFSSLEIETLPNYQVTAVQLTQVWPKGAVAAVDPEIEYRVRVTDNLVDWVLPDTGEVVESHHSIMLNLATGASRRFARLEVLRSPD